MILMLILAVVICSAFSTLWTYLAYWLVRRWRGNGNQ